MVARRTFIAAAGATLLAACGGGEGSPLSDLATDKAGKTTLFTVGSPAGNASVPATFEISGTAGTKWVNVAVYDSSGTKIGTDVTPSGGKWSTTVEMGSETGSQTLTAKAFSVPSGQSGGTSTSVNITLNVVTGSGSGLPVWGANGHYNQGGIYTSTSMAEQSSLLSANGMNSYRNDCWDQSTINSILNTVIPGMPGVTILPVWSGDPTSGSSQSSAYSQGYAAGQMLATAFAGVVPVVETGNEYDWPALDGAHADGNLPSDYSPSIAPMYVAYQAGVCNGFRSIDTTGATKVMLGGIAYLHTGFLQMIVNNIQPNGSAMSTSAATFDMIAWHYYNTGGNMESVNGLSGNYNLFTLIAAISSAPIVFTEVGLGDTSAGFSVSTAQSYINSAMAQLAAQPQVVGAIWYQLLDAVDGQGLYNNSLTAYGWEPTLASFIAANPG